MIRKLASIPAVLCLAFGLAACGSGGNSDGDNVPDASELDGHYISTSFEAEGVGKDQQFTLIFDATTTPDTPGLSAGAGCNSMNGTFEIKDGDLVTGNLISTMIGCPPDQAKAEEWLAKLLAEKPSISLDDGKLRLSGDAGSLDMEETAKVEVPTVEGVKWTLDGIESKGAVSSLAMGVKPPTLVFEDGEVTVFGGCNRGGGKAAIGDDGFITFSPIFMTRMSCGEAANQVEKQVVAFLDGKVAFAWEGANLVLSNNGKSLIFTT